jgi:hypothetical protein
MEARPSDLSEIVGSAIVSAESPRAMWAAGGLCRQIPADAAASQLGKASASVLPLLPGEGAQPSPDPFVKRARH